MNADLADSRLSPSDAAFRQLIDELTRLLIRIVQEVGTNIARIAGELELIRALLEKAALLKAPAQFTTDDKLGPGFGTA